MKNKIIQLIIFLNITFFVTQNLFADTHYVSKTGGHVSPFSSLGNAATNIQAAVDAASAGDSVLVNDGTYYPGDQISVTKNIVVKSINGAENTIVNGNNTNRCFYLNNANPTINGFTITNGFAYGDSPGNRGGGVYCDEGGTIQDCTISGNSAEKGAGVYCLNDSKIQNCTISGNSASDDGGGVFCLGGTVQNCTISGNSTFGLELSVGGGVVCVLKGMIQNCTISRNSAFSKGGGIYCNFDSTVQNCILWDNTNGNYFSSDSTNFYNCIENWTNLVNGIITNNPQFITVSNLRLQSTSPCRNIGTNLPYVFEIFDLDGNSRIMGATVDMGAYEYVEAIQYPPDIVPVFDDSEISSGKISWTPIIDKIPRAENFIVQEQFGGTNGSWPTIYTETNTSLLIQRITNAYYRVAAHNSIGNSDWSASVFFSNYPINVTSLNVSQLSDGSGYVSIDVWVRDQNLDLSDLKIEYSLNNGASWANGDPFLVSITQSGESPSINNSSEYQANNILPDNSTVTILWDTVSALNGSGSLANQRFEQSKVRLTPRNAYSQGYFMFSSPFVIDNLAVTNASVMINNNEAETSTPSVSLQLHAEGPPPLYMRISNGLDFGNSSWQNYTTWKSWTLSPASGTKTVYVQFKNDKGYISSVQDSILLDNWDFSNFEGAINVTYLMGRSGSVADEVPAHFVNLTTTAMYKTEISNFEFAQFLSEGGYLDSSYWSSPGWSWKTANSIVCPLYWETTDTPNYANDPYANSDSEPVVGISYYEAEAYANWSDYELPTESQWEYFAKDGDERHYPWADDFWYTSTQPSFNLCNWKLGLNGYTEMGFTSDGSEFTRYVTSYSEGKGHCGHYNLSGNVAEWVKDWYGTYGAATITDPEGPANGTERVVRGGSFVDGRDDLTTTRRKHFSPEFRTNWLGMRVAKNDIVPEGGFLIFNFIFLIYCLKRIK